MEQLTFRSLAEHPEHREELLRRVAHNSDWTFLTPWLRERLAELGSGLLPQIFAAFDAQGQMVGYYVLSRQEVIRHGPELTPWLGIVLVFDGHRGKKYSPLLIGHACDQARHSGFGALYLITEHEHYYERFGFRFIRSERYLSGEPTKLYCRTL